MHSLNVHILASAAGQRFGSSSCWSRLCPGRSAGVASARWQIVRQPASSHASTQADTVRLLRCTRALPGCTMRRCCFAGSLFSSSLLRRRLCGWQTGLQSMRFPKHAPLSARNIERLLVHLTESACTVQFPAWRLRGLRARPNQHLRVQSSWGAGTEHRCRQQLWQLLRAARAVRGSLSGLCRHYGLALTGASWPDGDQGKAGCLCSRSCSSPVAVRPCRAASPCAQQCACRLPGWSREQLQCPTVLFETLAPQSMLSQCVVCLRL